MTRGVEVRRFLRADEPSPTSDDPELDALVEFARSPLVLEPEEPEQDPVDAFLAEIDEAAPPLVVTGEDGVELCRVTHDGTVVYESEDALVGAVRIIAGLLCTPSTSASNITPAAPS